jgi:hypothetical protein
MDKGGCRARAKQDASNDRIQQVLNLGHALFTITQCALNVVVALCAYRLMHGQACVSILKHFRQQALEYCLQQPMLNIAGNHDYRKKKESMRHLIGVEQYLEFLDCLMGIIYTFITPHLVLHKGHRHYSKEHKQFHHLKKGHP